MSFHTPRLTLLLLHMITTNWLQEELFPENGHYDLRKYSTAWETLFMCNTPENYTQLHFMIRSAVTRWNLNTAAPNTSQMVSRESSPYLQKCERLLQRRMLLFHFTNNKSHKTRQWLVWVKTENCDIVSDQLPPLQFPAPATPFQAELNPPTCS